jgi:GT2 family glycosyltransferase
MDNRRYDTDLTDAQRPVRTIPDRVIILPEEPMTGPVLEGAAPPNCSVAHNKFAAAHCKPPTVSIIIPVHNGGEDFYHCLDGLRSAAPPPEEVIVVVDGATDRSAALAQGFGMRVMQTPVRSGPALARNLGASAARGDVLLFFDADVLIPAAIVGQMVEFFHRHPEVAAVIGSYDDAPTATNFLSQYKNLLHHYVHQQASEEGFTFWTGCGAIRRDLFLALGGFDEGYRQPSIEDIEFGYRLRAAGHRIRVCRGFQVKHMKRWTAASLIRSDFFHRALPWTRLVLRAGRFENDLNISRSNRIKVTLVYALLGLLGLAWWRPAEGLALAALAAGTLLTLDAPLLNFFRRKRGVLFAVRAVPLHWLSYFYCGLAFVVGLASFGLRDGRTGWGYAR